MSQQKNKGVLIELNSIDDNDNNDDNKSLMTSDVDVEEALIKNKKQTTIAQPKSDSCGKYLFFLCCAIIFALFTWSMVLFHKSHVESNHFNVQPENCVIVHRQISHYRDDKYYLSVKYKSIQNNVSYYVYNNDIRSDKHEEDLTEYANQKYPDGAQSGKCFFDYDKKKPDHSHLYYNYNPHATRDQKNAFVILFVVFFCLLQMCKCMSEDKK